MINNMPFEKDSIIHKRKRRLERHTSVWRKKKTMLSITVSLGLIIISSFFISYNIYISSNSKDLGFAVEHNFTSGFSSKNKLLRVQKMSLIYSDGDTAIVEASGLLKNPPHKSTSIRGSFKKDQNKSWHLDKLMMND